MTSTTRKRLLARVTLTYLDSRGNRTGVLTDRPGSGLIMSQAAWAHLTERQPLINGKPPFANDEAARQYLINLASLPSGAGMAIRALKAVAWWEAQK